MIMKEGFKIHAFLFYSVSAHSKYSYRGKMVDGYNM